MEKDGIKVRFYPELVKVLITFLIKQKSDIKPRILNLNHNQRKTVTPTLGGVSKC